MTWTSVSTVRIAVLDDHEVVRYGLAKRLAEEPDFQVVGAFATSRELMSALRTTLADVLIVDYSLGSNDIDGLNLIRALRVRFPHCKILVSSSHYNPATVALAMKAGARGFVGKSQELGELIQAIRVVWVGRSHLSGFMAGELAAILSANAAVAHRSDSLSENAALSPREREVLRCCLDGMTVTQIAEKFARSIKTISGQKQSAFRKLGVRSDNELFKIQHQIDQL